MNEDQVYRDRLNALESEFARSPPESYCGQPGHHNPLPEYDRIRFLLGLTRFEEGDSAYVDGGKVYPAKRQPILTPLTLRFVGTAPNGNPIFKLPDGQLTELKSISLDSDLH